MKRHLRFCIFLLIGMVFGIHEAKSAARNFDWVGSINSDWTNSLNWSGGIIGHLVPIAGDAVFIGVNNSITNMPVIASGGPSFSCASLTFGSKGAQSNYAFGIKYNVLLTINTGFTLTVTGNITQYNYAGIPSQPNNFINTTIAGNGTLSCSGNLLVGDPTQPANQCATVSQLSIQIRQFTVNGNVQLTATGNSTASGLNSGLCYPYLSIENGTTTLKNPIIFTTNASSGFFPILNAFNARNPGAYIYQGYGLVTVDNSNTTAANPCTLELQNAAPITKADNFYVYFTFGGNNGTILYDCPSGNQTVYTANEPNATNSATYINAALPTGISTASSADYYNLTLSGSNKIIDGNSTLGSAPQGLTVGNNFTTSGGVVDFDTNDPTVAITGTWTNSTTANQGSGTITTGALTNNASGIVNCGTASFTVNGNMTNNVSGIVNCGTANFVINGNYTNSNQFNTNATGQLFFSGSSAQSLTDNTATGTKFYNVTFNGGVTNATTTKTISTGPFSVVNTGLLTIGTNTTLAAGGNLTLMSAATGSANVAQIPATSSITGNVNVQRYFTGGNVKYRSYHLMSSPVNSSSATNGTGNIDLTYINTTKTIAGTTYPGALTAGPGGVGFTITNKNPVLYLYNESLPTNNTSFTGGKNVGIVAVGSSTVSTLSQGTTNTGVAIPVGNGIMFYFIGDNLSTSISSTRVPENTYVTATGTINQQNVPVRLWNTGTTALYATNNFVGNPYPSTIDLNVVYADNSATINRIFYELYNANPNQNYIAYNAVTGISSTVNNLNYTSGSRYIASGQGFFCTANTGGTITFKEDQKVTNQLTGATLLMSTPAQRVVQTDKTISLPDAVNPLTSFAAKQDNKLTGLHLAMVQDSTLRDECGIYFSNTGIDKFDENDAKDLDGISPKVYLSSYTTDGIRTGINDLGSYTKGKRIKLFVKATADGVYNLNLADNENIDLNTYNLYLKDNYAKDSLDLSRNSTYSFRIVNSDTTTFGANRFELVISPKPQPPYALNWFKAKKVNEGVLLSWKTANEGNFTGFTVEKQNGSQFTALNNVQSDGSGNYTYIDHNPSTGTNAYRLIQNGMEANISYSETVSVLYNSNSLTLYPNPAKDIINIYVNEQTNDNAYQMSIYDPSGTLVSTKQISRSDTQNVSQLRIGTYIVRVTGNDGKLIGNTKFSKIQ